PQRQPDPEHRGADRRPEPAYPRVLAVLADLLELGLDPYADAAHPPPAARADELRDRSRRRRDERGRTPVRARRERARIGELEERREREQAIRDRCIGELSAHEEILPAAALASRSVVHRTQLRGLLRRPARPS